METYYVLYFGEDGIIRNEFDNLNEGRKWCENYLDEDQIFETNLY